MNRRQFLAAAGAAVPVASARSATAETFQDAARRFKLGTVTYNIGALMDLDTLLATCKASGFEDVELRTTHAHQVEPDLPPDRRKEVRKRIEASGVRLWGLGTVCEFHAADPATVRKQVDDCRAFCALAADLGAKGVKVRPNGYPKGAEPARVHEQIGKALVDCGKAAADLGVEVWVEVHGAGTCRPSAMRAMMDECGHPSVGICWNSNKEDVADGSVRAAFDLLKKDLKSCHINELWSGYPYRELFGLLRSTGYDRVTLMEVAGVSEAANAKSPDAAVRFMRYYRALWVELTAGNR